MRQVMSQAQSWYAAGVRFALATVVHTWRSAPQPAGATMAVAETGEVAGSLSGGCVEGAVYELAREVLDSGKPVLERFGVSDEEAFAVGLTCGGVLDVFVRPVDSGWFPEFDRLIADIEDGSPRAVATLVEGAPGAGRARLVVTPGTHDGTLGEPGLDAEAAEAARSFLDAGRTGMVDLPSPARDTNDRPVRVFVESYRPAPRMLVFGAVDFARSVTRIGKFLGYHVTVCDARAVFATRARFPEADAVVAEWPHRFLEGVLDQVDVRTAICVLTHDPKFDVPVLEAALRTPAGYIGAMGSWRTHEDRERRLRERGVAAEELARIASPIGLDLGGWTTQETAVSIAAEIIATRRGGTGLRLAGTSAPIHHRVSDGEPDVSCDSLTETVTVAVSG